MPAYGYPALYDLQDAVLARVFSEPLGFYLTGGTALSRFHLNHRYSDDLDFFFSDAGAFADAFRIVLTILRATWTTLDIDVDARDFKRYFASDELAQDSRRLLQCMNSYDK